MARKKQTLNNASPPRIRELVSCLAAESEWWIAARKKQTLNNVSPPRIRELVSCLAAESEWWIAARKKQTLKNASPPRIRESVSCLAAESEWWIAARKKLKSNERQLALIKDPANQPSKTDGEIEDSPTREKITEFYTKRVRLFLVDHYRPTPQDA